MEGPVQRTVRRYLADNAPELYAELDHDGELEHFVYYHAAAISSRVDEQRRREGWDFLPHLDFVARVNAARALAAREVLGGIRDALAKA